MPYLKMLWQLETPYITPKCYYQWDTASGLDLPISGVRIISNTTCNNEAIYYYGMFQTSQGDYKEIILSPIQESVEHTVNGVTRSIQGSFLYRNMTWYWSGWEDSLSRPMNTDVIVSDLTGKRYTSGSEAAQEMATLIFNIPYHDDYRIGDSYIIDSSAIAPYYQGMQRILGIYLIINSRMYYGYSASSTKKQAYRNLAHWAFDIMNDITYKGWDYGDFNVIQLQIDAYQHKWFDVQAMYYNVPYGQIRIDRQGRAGYEYGGYVPYFIDLSTENLPRIRDIYRVRSVDRFVADHWEDSGSTQIGDINYYNQVNMYSSNLGIDL